VVTFGRVPLVTTQDFCHTHMAKPDIPRDLAIALSRLFEPNDLRVASRSNGFARALSGRWPTGQNTEVKPQPHRCRSEQPPPKPSRPEAIRRLIELGLKAAKSGARRRLRKAPG
jgi:hypothetical protein